jgi:hypothetical protein
MTCKSKKSALMVERILEVVQLDGGSDLNVFRNDLGSRMTLQSYNYAIFDKRVLKGIQQDEGSALNVFRSGLGKGSS